MASQYLPAYLPFSTPVDELVVAKAAIDRPEFRYNFSYILPMEQDFDPVPPTIWMQRNWTQSIVLSVLYVAFILGGRRLMANRAPFELKWPLILWNGALAAFSILGMLRFAPDFLWVLRTWGFTHSICVCAYHHGVTGFWTEMFALSKALELGDTAFIVFRKRPLMFLHWYHHITVMIYTWHAFKDHTAAGRWFIMMNYTVHSVMYLYYALRAVGLRFPKWIPMTITSLQLSQMIVGIVVAVSTFRIKRAGGECQQTYENLNVAFAMYFSYFLLFLHFFYQAYFASRRYDASGAAKKSDGGEKNGAVGGKTIGGERGDGDAAARHRGMGGKPEMNGFGGGGRHEASNGVVENGAPRAAGGGSKRRKD